MNPGLPEGSWNHCIGVLGVPGTGKSCYAVKRLLELGSEAHKAGGAPAYLLAHDAGWRLPERLPGGASVGLRRHKTTAALAAALRTHPGGVHALSIPDAGPAITYARRLGAASLKAGGGQRGVPVALLCDEIVSVGDASPYRLGPDLRELLAGRRHDHVALLWTGQSASLCHYQLLTLATEIVLFRLNSERDIKHLEKIGVPDTVLRRVRSLPNYQFIRYNPNTQQVVI